ncbi:chemotaxis protein CheW [Photobacterium sp. TY1-4]|uniref:chemotaxis protein CheW n=1 Tax=Photobacterium sp. TY1-4 TaxID=2899122 RepID=UPI0021BED239|nr:chemotaxis protein CheW [Photobacterium sp. TY1-4]UXI00563.1 chemotaxis protein CheW [Photobacterium sp. TY1-4]
MNDKQPLSSEQALDDYFSDLLAEPAEEFLDVAPGDLAETVSEETPALPPEERSAPLTRESAGGDVPCANGDDADTADDGTDTAITASGTAEAEDIAQAFEVDTLEADALETDDVAAHAPEETVSEDELLSDHQATDGMHSELGAAGDESQSAAPVMPFDFDRLDHSASEDVAPSSEAPSLSVALDLSSPAGNVSGWAPQPQMQPASLAWSPVDTAPDTVTFADKPDLDTVQRLLSQVSQLQPEQVSIETEPAALAEPVLPEYEPEPEVSWEDVLREEAAASEVVAAETNVPNLEREPLVSEPEAETGEPEAALETQAGHGEPPQIWQSRQSLDAEFQALFFEVNGVTFAVPLTELGGIHQLTQVNHLLGRPPWYLGLMTNREHQLDVVDTARWVMPEKLSSDDHQEDYRYIVMLGTSKWGLACSVLHGTETLTAQSVRWREQAGKRPWLAGMVKEKMCALIHVNELISMLNAGLDVKSVV